MAEAIQCDKCGKRYKFKPQLAGKAIKCPACGGVVRMPEVPQPPPTATPALADTVSLVDEELAADARQDELKLADSAPAAAWRGPSAPSQPANPYQSTYVPQSRERWNPRTGDPPIVKIMAIVVAVVVTLFCWGGAMIVLF